VIPTRREWIERERRREIHHCHFRLTITGDHVGPLAPAIAGGHERQSNETRTTEGVCSSRTCRRQPSSDLYTPVLGYQKQSQFAMGGLLGYDFGPLVLQGYLTSDVYEKNYGGRDVRGWMRIVLPLQNVFGSPPPPITRRY